MRIVIGTSLARYFNSPGRLDNRLGYALGLGRLGHEIYLVDDLGSKTLYNDRFEPEPFASWQGRIAFERLARHYGVWPRCCVIHGPDRSTHGLSYRALVRIAKTADLLINVQGKLRDPEIVERIPLRIYVDQAPGHTQVYETVYDIDRGLTGHHAYFTYGLNIGTARSEIPDCGVQWHPLLPPVFLDFWPACPPPRHGRFTTISKWASQGTFALQGRYSGEKADNWRKFIELPRRVSQSLEIALDIHPDYTADIRAFRENGWRLVDAQRIDTVQEYSAYIRNSLGEFSVANNQYVQFNTGWFSDRSARFLASGRPVVVQSTGIEHHLPVGAGILTFSDIDEAVQQLEAVALNYDQHCRAARRIAEEFFDSDTVLSSLIARATAATRAASSQ